MQMSKLIRDRLRRKLKPQNAIGFGDYVALNFSTPWTSDLRNLKLAL